MKKQQWTDGVTVTVPDYKGKIRTGTLEILSSQVFILFPEGDGVFYHHSDFYKEVRRAA
jgi:hypothetical protein